MVIYVNKSLFSCSDGEINVQQIKSNDNLADLFTKVLPSATFKKLVRQVGMRQLKDLQIEKLKTI